jgi:nicotinamidase-related amidase
MDYQNEIISNEILSGNGSSQEALLKKAGAVLQKARQAGIPVIYVIVCFRAGSPEISTRNKLFRGIKETGRIQEGTSGAEIHPDVAPQAGELIITKRRVGAFSGTELDLVLRAQGRDTLVLLGIATSGVVLSTVRWAADMDYNLVVLADCCADPDEEVHRVLIEKVFPRQATVTTAGTFCYDTKIWS